MSTYGQVLKYPVCRKDFGNIKRWTSRENLSRKYRIIYILFKCKVYVFCDDENSSLLGKSILNSAKPVSYDRIGLHLTFNHT